MTYLFNGNEINKQEMVGILGIKKFWESIHEAEKLFSIGCYEYEIWEGSNRFTFIPE